MRLLRNIFGLLSAGVFICASGFAQDGVDSTRMGRTAVASQDQVVVGAKVGIVNVDALGNAVVSYGAFGDYALANNLLVGGTLDYWSISSGSLTNEAFSANDLTLGGNGKFVFTDVRSAFKPFVLGGLSAHRLSVSRSEKVDSGDSLLSKYREKNNEVAGQVGIDLGGGALYAVQRDIDLNGQVIYRRLVTTEPNFSQLAFLAGVGYKM